MPLAVGPDADDPGVRFKLSALTTGIDEQRRVWLRLNHVLLSEPRTGGDWYHWDVPVGVLRTGRNELSIWCDKALAENPDVSGRSIDAII